MVAGTHPAAFARWLECVLQPLTAELRIAKRESAEVGVGLGRILALC
jgi:hypothetical protein